MKNQSSFNKLAGMAGITSALLFIVSIIGMQAYMASSLDDISAFTQNMNDSHNMMLLYGWPGIIATLLIIPLIYAFYKKNKSTVAISKMLFLMTVIGLCFILVGYLFHLALTYFHAPMYHELAVEEQATFAALIKSTIGLQDMFWLAGDLFSFLGIACLLLMGIRENIFPKWFLFMGILASVLAAVGSVSFIPAYKYVPGLSFSFIGGFSVFAVWETIAGVFLIKRP